MERDTVNTVPSTRAKLKANDKYLSTGPGHTHFLTGLNTKVIIKVIIFTYRDEHY